MSFTIHSPEDLSRLEVSFRSITQREFQSTLPQNVQRDPHYIEQLYAYFRQDPIAYIRTRRTDQRELLFDMVLGIAEQLQAREAETE